MSGEESGSAGKRACKARSRYNRFRKLYPERNSNRLSVSIREENERDYCSGSGRRNSVSGLYALEVNEIKNRANPGRIGAIAVCPGWETGSGQDIQILYSDGTMTGGLNSKKIENVK